jgi:hypothetical protein
MRRLLDRTATAGFAAGVLAFTVGYLATLAVTVVSERATLVARNNPEAAGWLYYNSQLANVETTGSGDKWVGAFAGQEFNLLTQFLWNDPVPTGQLIAPTEFFSGEMPAVVYHTIPVAVLFTTGLVFAYRTGVDTPWGAIIACGSITTGTTVAAALGTTVFAVSVGGLVVGPDPLEGTLMAGLFFPLLTTSLGGVVATELSENERLTAVSTEQ